MPLMLRAKQPQLNWLFIAHFEDGTTIAQTQKGELKGSDFKKVVDKQKTAKLVAFQLNHVDGKNTVTVELLTGTFIVNGVPMHAHNQAFNPAMYPLELVYFREVSQSINVAKNKDGSQTLSDPKASIGRYFIGWRTQVNGKPKQVTLAVA